MRVPAAPHKRNRYRSTANGKCICMSFPAHQTHLIDTLDHLADLECMTRSEWLREIIIRENELAEKQTGLSWNTLFGDK